MSAEHFWCCLSMLLSVLTVALYLLVFVDRWRFSPRISKGLLLTATCINTVVVVAAFVGIPSLNAASRVGMVSCVSAMAFIILLAHWQGGLLVFVLFTAFLGGCIPYYIFRAPGPTSFAIQLLVASFAFALMYRYFRPLFRSALLSRNAAWHLLALVPLSFTLIHLVIVAQVLLVGGAGSDPGASALPGVPILALRLMMILLPVLTYLLLYQLFGVLDRQYRTYRENLLRDAQLAALERQEENGQRLRERDRDLSGKLIQALDRISGQIASGDVSGALELAGKIDGGLATVGQRAKSQSYTSNTILDAVLCDYADRAEEAGVPLSIDFSLPSGWDLDALGLAVVLSNALENALTACGALPEGTAPAISLTTANTARQLVLEIRNTCAAPVVFDPLTGLPRPQQEGHGYGTRSMAAYARANRGTLTFRLQEGSFLLRLMLPLSAEKG